MKRSSRPIRKSRIKHWAIAYIVTVVLFHSAIYEEKGDSISKLYPFPSPNPNNVAVQPLLDPSLSFTSGSQDATSLTNATNTTTMAKYLHGVWRQTVQLIYRYSPKLDDYLSKPPPLVYVYDTLDNEFSFESVSQCLDTQSAESGIFDACGYYPRVCRHVNIGMGGSVKRIRNNFNSDVTLARLFQEYPYQTTDASKADLFVVPYPHRSHCFCKEDRTRCPYNFKFIQENVIDKLTHLDHEQNLDRHLFLLGSDFSLTNPPFRRFTKLHFSLGPADGCRPNHRTKDGKHWSDLCGSFTTPYVNLDPDYQPNRVKALISGNRKYSLTAIMTVLSHMKDRVHFYEHYRSWVPRDETIGGLPLYVDQLEDRQLGINTLHIYQQSLFCLVLAGDDCAQRRFFDVLMSGCIPVVLEFADSDEDSWSSWFRSGQCSRRRVYPFTRGVYYQDMQAGIDYKRVVVRIRHLSNIQAELEGVLANATHLASLRQNMLMYAQLWTFGLEEKATHQHVDAFSGLMVTLRHYLDHL